MLRNRLPYSRNASIADNQSYEDHTVDCIDYIDKIKSESSRTRYELSSKHQTVSLLMVIINHLDLKAYHSINYQSCQLIQHNHGMEWWMGVAHDELSLPITVCTQLHLYAQGSHTRYLQCVHRYIA